MILIADSGSTKTDWILTNDGKIQARYRTVGYNPDFIDTEEIYNSLFIHLLPQLDVLSISSVFFYGAGCSCESKTKIVKDALFRCFPTSNLFVDHDLLGAARALMGDTSGFVAIIGTGSNTCVYDGVDVKKNIDSLGYLLGDEGSGCYIGKRIVRDFMRDYLPEELKDKFIMAYHHNREEIFDFIYHKPLPNRFLASFCKFADENRDHSYVVKIVTDSFTDFFENLVSKYPEYDKYTFNCVGSVGFIFKDILKKVAKSYKMEMGKTIASPIDALVAYHLNKNLPTQSAQGLE